MLIAAIDVETSGLDFRTDKTIEVGAVLWDTDRQAPVHFFNNFIKHENLELTAKTTKLTGIDNALVDRWGFEPTNIASHIAWMLSQTNYALAFEADFDKGFIYRLLHEQNYALPNLTWIDARYDPPFKDDKGKGNLTLVLAKHEILNYFPHRAFGDIISTCKMVSKYNWENTIRRANTPTLEILANVSYQEKDLAKDAGFFWHPERKQWLIKMKEEDYSASGFCFPTTVLERPVIDYTS